MTVLASFIQDLPSKIFADGATIRKVFVERMADAVKVKMCYQRLTVDISQYYNSALH